MKKTKVMELAKFQKRKKRSISFGRAVYCLSMAVLLSFAFYQPVLAATDVWTKAGEIMKDVYNQIVLISTIAAIVTASVALLMMNFSRSGKTVDESRAWLKRICITWAILNGLGFSTAGYSGGIGGRMYASSVSRGGDFANNVISTVATGSMGMEARTMTGEKAVEALHSYLGYAALEEGAANVPQFSNVEIGGGRITGTEISEEYPGGVSFGMYHTGQYAQPEGNYSTVQTKDGASWYKQYAADKVEKSPYMAPDGSIAYKESIVKKLPQPPHRKDRM